MLAILVPARNEEENIGSVIDLLIGIEIKVQNIFVIDNSSTDSTFSIAKDKGTQIISVNEIGYERAISSALCKVKELGYKKFMIVDGDNEIDKRSIEETYMSVNSFNFICGRRDKVKRIGEKIVNKYYKENYRIEDLMCGLKAGDIELHNQQATLKFGLDMFNFKIIKEMEIKNVPVKVNQRDSTRLGNFIKVNFLLLTCLLKFHLRSKFFFR